MSVFVCGIYQPVVLSRLAFISHAPHGYSVLPGSFMSIALATAPPSPVTKTRCAFSVDLALLLLASTAGTTYREMPTFVHKGLQEGIEHIAVVLTRNDFTQKGVRLVETDLRVQVEQIDEHNHHTRRKTWTVSADKTILSNARFLALTIKNCIVSSQLKLY